MKVSQRLSPEDQYLIPFQFESAPKRARSSSLEPSQLNSPEMAVAIEKAPCGQLKQSCGWQLSSSRARQIWKRGGSANAGTALVGSSAQGRLGSGVASANIEPDNILTKSAAEKQRCLNHG